MSVMNFEECHCSCHYMEGVYHVVACCHQCPHCHMNIKTWAFEEHVKECEKEQAELLKLLDEHDERTNDQSP